VAAVVGGAAAQTPANTTQVCDSPSSASDAKDADYFDTCVRGAVFADQRGKFNFKSAYVINTTFTNVVFNGADFTYAFWRDVVFKDCVFKGGKGVRFDQALMVNVRFDGCVFEERAELTQITIVGGDFSGVDFKRGATLASANISATTVSGCTFAGEETLFDRVGIKTMAIKDTVFDAVRFQLAAAEGLTLDGATIGEFNCHEPLKDGAFGAKRAEFDGLAIKRCTIAKSSCDQSVFRGTSVADTQFGDGVHDFSSSKFTTLTLDGVSSAKGCAELDFADSSIEDGALGHVDVCKLNFGNTTLGALDTSKIDLADGKKVVVEGAVLDGSKVGAVCCVDFCKGRKCLCDIPGQPTDGCPRGTSKTNPNIDPSEDRKCFPASATVLLESGATVRMDALTVGDRVHVGRGAYSDVFMFTHKAAAATSSFVALDAASGAALRLTHGHYLYVNGALAPAGSVAAGDRVELASGAVDVVVRVASVSDTGLYNPQTLHGDVVVDGVRASTYTAAVEPAVAHAAAAPLRWLYTRFGATTSAFEGGADGALDTAAAFASVVSA
jgi:uncharacterized protein YjbI with pentapeptide repeats